ncbi:nucleotide 5'-monophosphate nucleosidase PpnN [Parahaliea mediterranea]|uniref:nucleotide 5'-monophosphate nucleosidase PpnN n=1 Tax=Parahaliea mediterranea TaxID=651086 RepID=UPI000E2E88E3|nr:nucleotide 5'-monophosphate nucleosidase PpnN [Parahaliea mediterranea]
MQKIPHAVINPIKSLNLLSRAEIEGLTGSRGELYELFRSCALAILNTDSDKDDAAQIYADYSDFDIKVVPQPRGLKLELSNAPAQAFVDGQMIRGIQEHLFSALRDIVYTDFKLLSANRADTSPADTTNMVFRMLRNARIVQPDVPPQLVVCWGGHAIPREEYDFAKQVGYELGLRGLDIVTGCGIGAMKGPMKGAAVGHAKQQVKNGRYIGISEPGIIASESPNAIVNELVIMPDIEKRLEAFVRLAHTIVVFPGGVGTVEEVLYLLSILMHEGNHGAIPLVFAGPAQCRGYFDQLERFLVDCLGEGVRDYYQVIVGDAGAVGRAVKAAVTEVHSRRRERGQAYYFNWDLAIEPSLQQPFVPTHDNMAALDLNPALPTAALASQLRRAFSGLVAGNVKAFGIEQVRRHGPYRIHGDPRLLQSMDTLLRMMVREQRMKLGECEGEYQPCYRLA